MKPASPAAYKLFHQGSLALAKLERTGMPVNVDRLKANAVEINDDIRQLENELRQDEIFRTQRLVFGKDASLGSREQLGYVLFQHMKLPGAKKSPKTGKAIVDDAVLANINLPYIDSYRRYQKLLKIRSTYVQPLLRDTVNGRLHGMFGLHNVKSFRGSSDSPNLNNLPTRNKSLSKYVKGSICPPPGYFIVEIDYSSLEVHVSACYHRDPRQLSDLENNYDTHSDVSKQCYKYDDDFIAKNKTLAKTLRQAAKGDAVFSWFYGNYYVDVCLRLWKTAQAQNMIDHLASVGIKRLGLEFDDDAGKWVENHGSDAFVTHIKAVEHNFWNVRYPIYNQWRQDWYRAYCQKGFFHTLTGFGWYGVEKRNFVINCPIQGSAFHCLLQSIIDIQAEIEARKMDAEIICEVHDSILAVVHETQLHDFVAMSNEIMTSKLRAKWPWICLDLKTEVEVSRESWWHKEAYTGKE